MDKKKRIIDTPMLRGIENLSPEEKIEKIESLVAEIITTLGLNLKDNSLCKTPNRVAKMYVNELFYGLQSLKKPDFVLFENPFKYDHMLIEKDIRVCSMCEHHLLPMLGKAHVAYISSGKVIGLSKLNRIVDYYSRRPQIQERLCIQIASELQNLLETEDVAVIIDSKHHCVSMRGIQDINSTTITSQLLGKFKEQETKTELFQYLSI